MSLAGNIKGWINRGLLPWNVRIQSLTAERAEKARLVMLDNNGHFDRAVLPVLDSFAQCDPQVVLDLVSQYKPQRESFLREPCGGSYSYHNNYYTSPDAEVAYSLVRHSAPRTIVEVGSGNSTFLLRAAIRDGGLGTELIAVDPAPRIGVADAADHLILKRVEEVDSDVLVAKLRSGDILFIDSSHQVEVGNDVLELVLRCLPRLEKGVIVHFHDIFLPYEYPREWVVEFDWKMGEQYLVHALLADSQRYEVIWAGHYHQRTLSDFGSHFDQAAEGRASSLWLRVIS